MRLSVEGKFESDQFAFNSSAAKNVNSGASASACMYELVEASEALKSQLTSQLCNNCP